MASPSVLAACTYFALVLSFSPVFVFPGPGGWIRPPAWAGVCSGRSFRLKNVFKRSPFRCALSLPIPELLPRFVCGSRDMLMEESIRTGGWNSELRDRSQYTRCPISNLTVCPANQGLPSLPHLDVTATANVVASRGYFEMRSGTC